jgi:hypothetical protein
MVARFVMDWFTDGLCLEILCRARDEGTGMIARVTPSQYSQEWRGAQAGRLVRCVLEWMEIRSAERLDDRHLR